MKYCLFFVLGMAALMCAQEKPDVSLYLKTIRSAGELLAENGMAKTGVFIQAIGLGLQQGHDLDCSGEDSADGKKKLLTCKITLDKR